MFICLGNSEEKHSDMLPFFWFALFWCFVLFCSYNVKTLYAFDYVYY